MQGAGCVATGRGLRLRAGAFHEACESSNAMNCRLAGAPERECAECTHLCMNSRLHREETVLAQTVMSCLALQTVRELPDREHPRLRIFTEFKPVSAL